MAAGLRRRLLRAGGWRVAKRIIKPIPVVGTAKGLVELFTGDLIRDKEPDGHARQKRLPSK